MNNLCNNTIKIYEINYFIFVNFFLYFRKKLLKNDKNIFFFYKIIIRLARLGIIKLKYLKK